MKAAIIETLLNTHMSKHIFHNKCNTVIVLENSKLCMWMMVWGMILQYIPHTKFVIAYYNSILVYHKLPGVMRWLVIDYPLVRHLAWCSQTQDNLENNLVFLI